jgi:hypothetical protein
MYKSSQIYPKSKANLTGFTEGFDFFSRRWWSNVFFFRSGWRVARLPRQGEAMAILMLGDAGR